MWIPEFLLRPDDLHGSAPIHDAYGNIDQVVVIVFPFQSIGVQLIEIAIMFENSLFFLGVLIILKLDLMTLQYGILDAIDDVIDLFVMWLDSARNCSQTLEFFRPLTHWSGDRVFG